MTLCLFSHHRSSSGSSSSSIYSPVLTSCRALPLPPRSPSISFAHPIPSAPSDPSPSRPPPLDSARLLLSQSHVRMNSPSFTRISSILSLPRQIRLSVSLLSPQSPFATIATAQRVKSQDSGLERCQDLLRLRESRERRNIRKSAVQRCLRMELQRVESICSC